MPGTCALQIRCTGSRTAPWKTLRSYPLISDALRAAASPAHQGQDIQIKIVPKSSGA